MKILKLYFMLILELIMNIKNARLIIYHSNQCFVNNISLCNIEYTSQLNNIIFFIDKLCDQLNDMKRKKQSLDLKAKLAQIIEKFPKTSNAIKIILLKDIDLKLNMLNKVMISMIQDSLKFKR